MSTTQTKTGLFLACYEIGGDMPGAPLFGISLTVNTPSETINGMGNISQAINPPLDVKAKLEGTYTYMTVMPKNTHILVNVTGYPVVQWPSDAGIGPVIQPIAQLQMVLSDDWSTGTANYKYLDNNGMWHSITDAPVKAVSCNVLK